MSDEELELLRQKLEQQTQRVQELEQEAADNEFRAEDLKKLQDERSAMAKTLDETKRLLGEEQKNAATLKFQTARDKALQEIGLEADHPAVALAFPAGQVFAGEELQKKLDALKAVKEKMAPPKPNEEPKEKDESEKWVNFSGGLGEHRRDGSEDDTEVDRKWTGAKETFRKTGNLRDLARGMAGRVCRMTQRRTPGGMSYYEKREVKQ